MDPEGDISTHLIEAVGRKCQPQTLSIQVSPTDAQKLLLENSELDNWMKEFPPPISTCYVKLESEMESHWENVYIIVKADELLVVEIDPSKFGMGSIKLRIPVDVLIPAVPQNQLNIDLAILDPTESILRVKLKSTESWQIAWKQILCTSRTVALKKVEATLKAFD